MKSHIWVDVHGAATHFPIALVLSSLACDSAALALRQRPIARRLEDCGTCAIVIAGVATLPAVASGLVLTHGISWGAGALRWHHLFVWPAFGLIIGAAVWRALIGQALTRRLYARYVAILFATAVLISAAGYWGGQLLNQFP